MTLLPFEIEMILSTIIIGMGITILYLREMGDLTDYNSSLDWRSELENRKFLQQIEKLAPTQRLSCPELSKKDLSLEDLNFVQFVKIESVDLLEKLLEGPAIVKNLDYTIQADDRKEGKRWKA